MSCTQGWDYLIATQNYLAAVRSLVMNVYGAAWVGSATDVPVTTTSGTQYVDANWALTFELSKANITVSASVANTLDVSVPFYGTFTGPVGIVSNPNATSTTIPISIITPATLTLSVDVSDLVITSTVSASTETSQTVEYYYAFQDGAFSNIAVSNLSSDSAAALQLLFETALDDISGNTYLIGSKVYDLNTKTESYIYPSQMNFITNSANDEVVICGMLSGHAAPTGSWQQALDSSDVLTLPSGSNTILAISDTLILNEATVLLQDALSDNSKGRVSVSLSDGDPAVLTLSVHTHPENLSLAVSFATTDYLTQVLSITGVYDASEQWNGAITISDNIDGTQQLSFVNKRVSSSGPTLNQNNSQVIAFEATYASLLLLSPLHGAIFLAVAVTIESIFYEVVDKIFNGLNSALSVSVTRTYNPTKTITKTVSGVTITTAIAAPLQAITFNSGIIVAANLSVSTS
ncbi:MAG: hypothetical protein ACT4NV_17695 [Rhodoferax sp.]